MLYNVQFKHLYGDEVKKSFYAQEVKVKESEVIDWEGKLAAPLRRRHTWKKRVMWRGWLFWPKKLAEKVRKSRQNVNRDKSA